MANISKNVRAAKRTIENFTDIQDIVNANAVAAVQTIVNGMLSSEASEATRMACAKEILKLQWLFGMNPLLPTGKKNAKWLLVRV
jgi:hypothetical protein